MNNFQYIYKKSPPELSFPSQKDENWKHVNVKSLKKYTDNKIKSDDIFKLDEKANLDCDLLIDNNCLSTSTDIPSDISIKIIQPKDIKNLPKEIKERIGKIAKNQDYFLTQNTKYFQQLVLIEINKNMAESTFLNINLKSLKKNDIKPRFFIHVNSGAEATINVNFDNQDSFVNGVFEIQLEPNAKVDFFCHSEGKKSFEITNYWVDIKEGAKFSATFTSLGSEQIIKNDIRTNLIGENADVDLAGLYVPKPKSTFDYNLKINHKVKKTTSSQLFKGILNKNSRASFTGLVKIDKDCSDCKSFQANNNLLLSEKAQIKSDPQLEIYCDEVECSHGSTIGQFDEDALFYICSRGISKKNAKNIMLEAFYSDVLDRVINLTLKESIKERIL